MTTPTREASTPAPPAWANAAVLAMLKTPGLRRLIGSRLAILHFDGRRSGSRYEIPVTYTRYGDRVIMVTRRERTWWRNFVDRPEVELVLAGESVTGKAHVLSHEAATLSTLSDYLLRNRIDARIYGIEPRDGSFDPDDLRRMLDDVAVIAVDVD